MSVLITAKYQSRSFDVKASVGSTGSGLVNGAMRSQNEDEQPYNCERFPKKNSFD
jgi:hypothetical protein